MKTCKNCCSKFEPRPHEVKFYKEHDLPEPFECPICRQQRRMLWRNEKNLYKRKCDLCGKDMVTIYSPDKLFKVYCQDCFWGDKWNAHDYGREVDFGRPFFEQFAELMVEVPRLAVVNKKSENSEYCNYSFANKNCYLTFGNHYEWDCLYGHYSTKNKNCVDYLQLYKSELCYDILFSKNCYNCVALNHCENCHDCLFSVDLKSCEHCLFCANLRHKKYCIFNKEYSKEEYFKKLGKYDLGSYKAFEEAKKTYRDELSAKFPVRDVYQVNCQDCVGSNLENCKELFYCFDCAACEDCSYGFQMDETYDSLDMTCMGYDRSEVCHQTIGCSGLFNCMTCDSCWHGNDLRYCNMCFTSKNCFGCISVQHGDYCILNKKYSKEEYAELMGRLVEHMKKTGEWGQFFPASLSPFGYNESVAHEYMPLSADEARAKEFNWKKEDKKEFAKQKNEVPDHIDDVSDSVLDEVMACVECGRNFKLVPQELKFYKQVGVPVPRKCSDCRDRERIALRTPRRLWKRACSKCGVENWTTYSPERPEKVYCEKCYEGEVY